MKTITLCCSGYLRTHFTFREDNQLFAFSSNGESRGRFISFSSISYSKMETVFEYDLEEGKETSDAGIHYAVRYTKGDVLFVEVGDRYRHNIMIEARHWNVLLKVIRNDKLDREGIEAIISLMRDGLPEEYVGTFINAIKSGALKDVK